MLGIDTSLSNELERSINSVTNGTQNSLLATAHVLSREPNVPLVNLLSKKSNKIPFYELTELHSSLHSVQFLLDVCCSVVGTEKEVFVNEVVMVEKSLQTVQYTTDTIIKLFS